MSKYKELKQIIAKLKPVSFLEIGIDDGSNLISVDCPHKIGIDPEPKVETDFPYRIYRNTSDNVFGSDEFKKAELGFDLIFIDGLHKFKQVVRDVENSLSLKQMQ